MFRALKYILLANLFKKAKNRFIYILVSLVVLVMFVFIINDITSIVNEENTILLFGIKWVSIVTLLISILYNSYKIIQVVSSPFQDEKKSSTKKEHILKKDKLLTKSELIIQKYKSKKR